MRILSLFLIAFSLFSCTRPEPEIYRTEVHVKPLTLDEKFEQTYQLIDMKKIGQKVNRGFKRRPLDEIEHLIAVSKRYKVSPVTAMALLYQESDGTRIARAPVGALGLMQIMPKDHYSGPAADLIQYPKLNISLGIKYLKVCIRTTGNDWQAVQAYNTGHGAWLKGIRSKLHAKRVFRIRKAIQEEVERIYARKYQETLVI